MNTSSDAAESMVRMSLQGIEVAAKITGAGAKNTAAILYAILKDKQQTRGKTSLVNMLKTGKELKIFSLKEKDLKVFVREAKRYGVLYTALVNKKYKNPDGMIDIMVRAEDAAKINRIVEKFNLGTVDTAQVKSDISKSNNKSDIIEVSIEDKIVDDILSKPEKNKVDDLNPSLAKTEKSPLSEPVSNQTTSSTKGSTKRVSVRKKLKEITKSLNKKDNKNTRKKVDKTNTIKNKKTKGKSR